MDTIANNLIVELKEANKELSKKLIKSQELVISLLQKKAPKEDIMSAEDFSRYIEGKLPIQVFSGNDEPSITEIEPEMAEELRIALKQRDTARYKLAKSREHCRDYYMNWQECERKLKKVKQLVVDYATEQDKDADTLIQTVDDLVNRKED